MATLATNGQVEMDLKAGIESVQSSIGKVVSTPQYVAGAASVDGSRHEISSVRTPFNWGTAFVVTLSGSVSGTHVVVDYDNKGEAPNVLLELSGQKNLKAANRFLEELEAAL